MSHWTINTGMPRAFSEDERARIDQSIRTAGLKRFSRQGIRGVRIDDLCRDAGIAKGTFYAFFPSKEELFMSIADAADERHKRDMLEYLTTEPGDGPAVLGGFFDMMVTKIESDPVLAIVRQVGELEYLLTKLPPSRLAENEERDQVFLRQASEILVNERRLAAHADHQTLQGVMTMLLTLSLQRELVGPTAYRQAVALLKEMSLQRLIRGPDDISE